MVWERLKFDFPADGGSIQAQITSKSYPRTTWKSSATEKCENTSTDAARESADIRRLAAAEGKRVCVLRAWSEKAEYP